MCVMCGRNACDFREFVPVEQVKDEAAEGDAQTTISPVALGSLAADVGDTTTTAGTITLGVSIIDVLESQGDNDWFSIQLTAGEIYEFRLHGIGPTGDELRDPLLVLRNSTGAQVASNDDAGSSTWSGANGLDSRIVFTAATSGTYYVDVGAFQSSSGTNDGQYIITAVEQNSSGMIFTNDEVAWQLTNNFNEWFSSASTPAAGFNVGSDGSLTYNVTALTSAGAAMARDALEQWADITGINFVETTGVAEITFDDSDPGITAYANTSISGGFITSANVMVTTGWLSNFGTGFGSYSYETYVHEVGHALGLGHGGNYNGSATYGTDNFYLNDSVFYSIMSYMQAIGDEFTGPNTTLPADFRFMQTASVADALAMEILYGGQLSSSTRTGNTTYGYNSNTGNAALDNAVNIGSNVFMMVHDDGGTDTIDLSGYGGHQFVSLYQEAPSNVLGGIWNMTISRGTQIENLLTGAGADVLRGNDLSNYLDGGAGIDSFYGNGGNDIMVVNFGDRIFENANEGFDTVRALGSAYTLTANAHVERLMVNSTSSTNSVTLVGNEFTQQLLGNNGDNILVGGGGVDSYIGYLGNDIYVTDHASETIIETAGQGYDSIYTSVSYTIAAGLSIERFVTTSQAGTAAINLTGNEIGQVMGGNAAANVLYGGGGNDSLYGYNGNDVLDGAQGNDSLFGGAGVDRFIFRESVGVASGIDRIYDMNSSDNIVVDALAVSGLRSLGANEFRYGTAALDADDRIIYDTSTGRFWFDPDGSGAQSQILFGVINGAPLGVNHTWFELS